MCEIGETYLIPSGPDLHLFVVATEADDAGMHVLVGVTSIDPDLPHDATCEFEAGEHAFIKRPSFAAYEFAIHRHRNHVDDKTKKRVYKKHRNATPALVTKIADGIKKSTFTKRAIKDGYDACLRATAKRKNAKT